ADNWPQPRLMAFLQAQGNIEPEEFVRTFNCGIGMALIVPENNVKSVLQALEYSGEVVWKIGRIEAGERGCTVKGSPGTWSGRASWSASHHG
ncbi:MAG TPA: AIR synthase-related protein, partial [Allosphingosinicella sp.]|nr:AIR synthase-related protein [Allosphingosinicella sp.]